MCHVMCQVTRVTSYVSRHTCQVTHVMSAVSCYVSSSPCHVSISGSLRTVEGSPNSFLLKSPTNWVEVRCEIHPESLKMTSKVPSLQSSISFFLPRAEWPWSRLAGLWTQFTDADLLVEIIRMLMVLASSW